MYKNTEIPIFVEKRISEQLRFIIHHSLHFTVKMNLYKVNSNNSEIK